MTPPITIPCSRCKGTGVVYTVEYCMLCPQLECRNGTLHREAYYGQLASYGKKRKTPSVWPDAHAGVEE